jgi:hypothetical protein
MYLLSLTLANGEFVPGDHDSFYHARRILHAVAHWPALYQFDALIHAPEGSWLTWPWGFDFTLALIVKALLGLGVSVKPISILVFVAPCWVLVNAGLMLAIGVRLRLGLVPAALVMLAFATSSLTLALHHVGMIDHHFVELSFVLATLYCGLGWLETPENAGKACWLGLWLGLAPAFHNGDFILQLPVLGSLAVLWWLRKPPPLRASAAFAFTLLAVSALALLPSEPFRRLMYSYTLHSWFHLHVAACTASAALVLSGPRSGRRALWLVACVAAGLPILGEMQLGSEFLLGRLEQLSGMTEVTGVVDYLRAGEFARLFELYSLLICLLPAGVACASGCPSSWLPLDAMSLQTSLVASSRACARASATRTAPCVRRQRAPSANCSASSASRQSTRSCRRCCSCSAPTTLCSWPRVRTAFAR